MRVSSSCASVALVRLSAPDHCYQRWSGTRPRTLDLRAACRRRCGLRRAPPAPAPAWQGFL